MWNTGIVRLNTLGLMDVLQFAIIVIIQQVSLARGAVNLTSDDYGYINQSIVFQCKTDDGGFHAISAVWSLNGNIFSTTASRFIETRTSDGFLLSISNLTTADEGDYVCGIDFETSSIKVLTILYNTTEEDVLIQPYSTEGKLTISIVGYPDPIYIVTVTEVNNGIATPVTVSWAKQKTTQASGVIQVVQTSYNFTKAATYNITVNITSTLPRPVTVSKAVQFASATTTTATTSNTNGTTTPGKPCELELGLGLGLGLGIPCVITIIVVVIFVIFVYKGYTYAYILGLLLGLGLGLGGTFDVGWIIIVSVISTGNKCKLELGLGLGLGSGMPCVIAIVVAVILMFYVCKGIPCGRRNGIAILIGLLIGSGIGIIVVYLFYEKLKAELRDEEPEEPTEPNSQKNNTKVTGPPAVHTGTQNKVEPKSTSKQINDIHQPLQHEDTGVKDTPNIRPLPQPPQNSDTKNRNQQGVFATIDDTQGLENETPLSNKLPPLKVVSEETKRKRKKKKRKGQMNDGNPEEYTVPLKSSRTLPVSEDKLDGD